MKQFSAKKLCCNVLNFKNGITILKGVVIFLLFSVGATARTSNPINAPGKTNSVNTPPPSCQAGFTDSTSDRVAYFTSTSTDTNASTEYRWQFGDGGISHQVNPVHRYATGGNYTVCLTIRNIALGCEDSICHSITITQCSASFDTTTSGNLLTVTSTSTGVDDSTTYDWNFGDGGIGHQPNQTHTYLSTGTYEVCLTIINTETGCSSQSCDSVKITSQVSVCGADFTDSTSGQEGIFTSTSTNVTTATQYKWSFGDGTISHQQNPVHRYALAGKYNVCLIITDSTESYCNNTFCDSVTVTPNVNVCGADFSDSTSGLEGIFTSISTGITPSTNYVWNFGDGGISHQQNPVHRYSAPGKYDVCLTITDPTLSFCDSTFCDSVTVTPNVSICGADFTDSTSGQQAIFTSTSTGTTANTRYVWNFGDGGISHQQNPVHRYGAAGKYDVCLTITDPTLSFCDSTFCDSVTVTPNVSICGADFTDSTSGQQAIFTSTSTGTTANTRYVWNFGDGGISHQQNPVHNYGAAGKYDVCLTITDPTLSFCDSTFCDSVTVTPNVSICGADFTDSTSGQQAIFTSTSTGTTANTRYVWNFGDGGISHQQNPVHNYGAAGKYDVCLTITDPTLSFCDSTFCDSVTVTPNVSICGADFTDSTSGQQAIFTSTSTGTTANTRYVWNFGDGGISHQQNPIHRYGAAGKYDVCLTITDSTLSFCDSTFCDSVTVMPNVSVCGADFTSSSVGFKATFTSTSTDTTTSTRYVWSFGDGGLSHQVNPVHNYAAVGKYDVCLTITDPSESFCDSTFCDSVTITTPVSTCGADFTDSTSGQEAIFTSTSTNTTSATQYHWVFGDGGISHQQNPIHRYAAAGKYDVCLTILDSTQSFCDSTFCDSVTVTPYVSVCGADFISSSIGFKATFTSTSTDTTSSTKYNWSFGDGGISHQTNPNHNFGAAGKYDVCLTISDSTESFCDSTFCDSVTITAPVNVCGADFTDSTSGQEAIFTSTSTDTTSATQYHWVFGDGGISHQRNPIHRYAAAGKYDVCLTILDSTESFCDSTFCDSVTVTPNVSVCGADFASSSIGFKATFTSTSTDTTSSTKYNWSFGDGGISHQMNPVHNYGVAGKYDVCLTISDSTESFCDSTFCDSVTITAPINVCGADFTFTADSTLVKFTSASTDTTPATQYHWSFGDGGISHQMNPQHIYKTAGKYDVCLTITDSTESFCDTTFCDSVTTTSFISTCQASFDTSVNGRTVMFTSTSTDTDSNTNYFWSFGDGGISHQVNPTHLYPATGAPICSVPITLSNGQGSPTPTDFEQQVIVNSSLFSANELAGLQNVEFTTGPSGTGTPLNAWLESGDTNTSVNTVWWVNLGSSFIPANNDLIIYMNFMPSSVLSASGPTGEAPQLSGTYAQYDNGSLVFPEFYDNFAGTSLASQWTNDGEASIAVNNGLTISNANSNWNAIYDNTFSSALNNIAESYCATDNTNGGGLCINTSGTDGNGINDGSTGVDAQLTGPSGVGYMFGSGGSCTSPPDANATIANASPADNTYYVLSFFMFNTPVLQLNYGAFTSLTGTNGAVDAISPNSEVGLGVSEGSTGSFQWFRDRPSPPNGIMPGANVGSLTCQTSTGKYDVCLTIFNGKTGCSSTSCDTVTIAPQISVCGADFTNTTSNLKVQFTSTSTDTTTATQYKWIFGDGGVSHQVNPQHIYAKAGKYNVCLTIADSTESFCDNTFCDSITITSPVSVCGADFTNSTGSQTVQFTSTSTDTTTATQYKWTFGDGGISHQVNPQHIYANPGKYDVCLLIVDSTESFCDSTFCDSITVSPNVSVCGADFTNTSGTLKVQFTSTSTDTTTATQYKWTFGDGGISHEVNPQHIYATAGKYDVCLTIADATESFCDSTICDSITVSQPNVCGADFTNSTGGLLVHFTNTSTDTTSATEYRWTFGDDSISHAHNAQHTYKKPGKYEVCLLIVDSTESFCDSTFCDSITVTTALNVCGANFTSSGDGLKVSFTNTSTGTTSATQYKWSFGDDSISHQKNPLHNYKAAGTYEVCLYIRDSTLSICDTDFCDSVKVTSPTSECTADFTWTDVKGQGIHFYSDSKGTTSATQYSWNLGDGTVLQKETDPSHRYKQSGTYYVCLTITDSTETYCNSTFCDSVPFVLTGIEELSFPGSSLYYDESSSQIVLNWVGSDNVAIHLVDILGRNDQDIYVGNLSTGTYRFNVNSSIVASGIYFIHMTAIDGDKAWKIFVLPH